MNRRAYLAALGGTALAASAGCSAPGGRRTLSDPTVSTDSPGRKTASFALADRTLGEFSADGAVDGDLLRLTLTLRPGDGARTDSFAFRLWMPDAADVPAEIALVSPVQGDASPPPSVTLATADDGPGQVVRVTDLDDLSPNTVRVPFLVRPRSGTPTTVAVRGRLRVTDTGALATRYALHGGFRLRYPALGQ
ncbi:MAG: hypothetical protein ABEJ80_02495 [Halarchaeum sp.]